MTAASAKADASPAPTTVRRRWLQFRLRTLLLATLVLCVLFGLFAIRLQRARRQAEALATIRKLGGVAMHDFAPNPASPHSKWLVRLLGEDFFHEVTTVYAPPGRPRSASEVAGLWRAVGQLTKIGAYEATSPESGNWIDGRRTTEAFRRHDRLRYLSLNGGNIKGQDLKPLAELKQLETLFLSGNPIGDDGVRCLSETSSLTNLDLSRANVSDEGVVHLARCQNLRHLQLNFTKVGDRGASELQRLHNLESLSIGRTKVTDAGLSHLSSLKNLRVLNAGGNRITDQGFDHLAAMPQLQAVTLDETLVTPEGLERFRAARPKMWIAP